MRLDAHGRYQRMLGRRAFQPIGFDAFGINAVDYARRVDEHPRTLIALTTANFRRQLSSLGCAWTWSAEVTTSDPSSYRWTQWILVQLFRAGLLYQADAPGTSGPWYLRTTAYADRLLAGLDDLDWPERAKRLQRAWIGRSENPPDQDGAEGPPAAPNTCSATTSTPGS